MALRYKGLQVGIRRHGGLMTYNKQGLINNERAFHYRSDWASPAVPLRTHD